MRSLGRAEQSLSTDPDFALYPQLKFYYGFTLDELINTPRHVLRYFAEALPALLASEQIKRIEAASFTSLKHNSDRTKLLNHYRREIEESLRAHTPAAPPPGRDPEEAAQALMGIGIAAEFVDKDGMPIDPMEPGA